MAEKPSVVVGLATYNELENLPRLVEAIHQQLPEARVLVLDDNSPDGTGDWCRQQEREWPWFSSIHREGKLGLGSALVRIMQWSISERADYLITLDADWSHPPDRLPALLAAMDQADVVVGSRYCQGGSIVGWPWYRKLTSTAMNSVTRLVTGLQVTDCSGNFRAYRTEVLSRLDWSKLNSTGYAFIEEILWELKQVGARFAEVPIVFTNRVEGKSKVSGRELVGAVKMLCRLTHRRLFSRKRSQR